MAIPIYQADSFTDKKFYGNPAAVCLLDGPRDETWMQLVAREMNQSETAFLYPGEDGFNLRWFTPAVEVDLCGHATLASAHILWEAGLLKPDQEARFLTKSGLLTARKQGEWIELNFPAEPPEQTDIPEIIREALAVRLLYWGKNRLDYLVEVESESVVRELKPDFSLLKKLKSRGVIVTSRAESEPFDFVSRFFAPAIGIEEDPVTGSAHCCLGPYWQKKTGRDTFLACQLSARAGVVKVRVAGGRVRLGGQAVTVFKGEMR